MTNGISSSFTVEQKTSLGGSTPIATIPSSAFHPSMLYPFSYVVKGLKPASSYQFSIAAFNFDVTNSGNSPWMSVTTLEAGRAIT